MLKQQFILLGLGLSLLISLNSFAQHRKIPKRKPAKTTIADDSTRKAPEKKEPKKEPKKFEDFLKKDSKSNVGLFTIHHQEEKYYFEIPDSLLERDLLVVNRITKSGADLRTGMSGYAGDQINKNVIRFEKGPRNKIFLRKISFSERSSDSTQAMYRAVMNSNIQPIAGSFDIVAFSKDSAGSVIDMTGFINGDNDILFFAPYYKSTLRLGNLQADKSYISSIRTYPMNTEVSTVKTYGRTPPPGTSGPTAAQLGSGTATLELNTSLVLLPREPMQARYFDSRVGYFTVKYTDFDLNPQGVKTQSLITRWRLEPKEEDLERYKRGEPVEPIKPIVYYIDPATPEKWVPYLIAGVNDWQSAFEQAGFKNAIVAKRAPTPEEDPEWSLEDARYSAIVYKPSTIPNASGPHVNDPRSGEILESHINWYHNVMYLLRNWYFVQASPNDERARKMQFDDELMGELIRFVSSHEVGHTLGLRHNFGSSSAYPVEKLRDAKWVKEHGHAASIMDYARFNYVAQPGDGISGKDLYPKINYYDKWAIEWGYKLIPEAHHAAQETPILNQWVLGKADDPKYWFGTESNPNDPRSQNEDLGDDAMQASTYGIKNLRFILPNLKKWTSEPNKDYENLGTMYGELINQFGRYAGHVAKNVGGIYETPKTIEQSGTVYEHVSKNKQHKAMLFLSTEIFDAPKWLINYEIGNLSGSDPIELIGKVQKSTLDRILSTRTLSNLIQAEVQEGSRAYTIKDLFTDFDAGIWSELNSKKAIDVYKRNLQKHYVNNLIKLLSPPTNGESSADPTKSDVSSVARGQLISLQKNISGAITGTTDTLSKYHLQDLSERIRITLQPGSK
ncbi:zinc-dependent metalloprotease [Olivibacter sp. SDN3]|uniref:zinc-dependent metalloprotease n=1 Tax=Olivibacter sp. SDN3 TaxID=2764720 RepID=UPI0016510D6A|nr:zinc-dependent metalloprotease [Olivibacter sp. SDN3]QNL50819.1 zinc-dependent metalloprotease [Olivibacter sp. SDN3]